MTNQLCQSFCCFFHTAGKFNLLTIDNSFTILRIRSRKRLDANNILYFIFTFIINLVKKYKGQIARLCGICVPIICLRRFEL